MMPASTGTGPGRLLSLRRLFTLWALIQLGRLIAWPLVLSAWAGTDPAAWLFPAFVDLVVAAGVPLAIWTVWTWKSPGGWLFLMLWLGLSIVDHFSAATAFAIAGVPSVFKDFGEGGVGVPMVQAAVDLIFLASLHRDYSRRLAASG